MESEPDQCPGSSQIGLGVLGIVVESERPFADGGLVTTEGHQGQGPWHTDRPRGASEDGTVQVDEGPLRVPRLGLQDPSELEQTRIARHESQGRLDVREGGPHDRRISGEPGRGPGRRRPTREPARRRGRLRPRRRGHSGRSRSTARVRWAREDAATSRFPPARVRSRWSAARRSALNVGPAAGKDRQVIGTAEPEKLLDPAESEQRPDPEPFAARAGLASVGACGVLLRVFQPAECQPGQGAARE